MGLPSDSCAEPKNLSGFQEKGFGVWPMTANMRRRTTIEKLGRARRRQTICQRARLIVVQVAPQSNLLQ